MATRRFVNARRPHRLFHRELKRTFLHVVPPFLTRARIQRDSCGWKDKLPCPFPRRLRIFPGQRVRQVNFTKTIVQILLVLSFHFL